MLNLTELQFQLLFWSAEVYCCIWFLLWKDHLASKISFSFSFCRVTELFGSLNCISELSKKKKKAWDCSICFSVFLMQVVITPWCYSSQRTSCVLKKSNMHRVILYMFVPPQFMLDIVRVKMIGCKVSLRVFLLGYSWHQSGTAVSKHGGWWRSHGGHAPSKGQCCCKAAEGCPSDGQLYCQPPACLCTYTLTGFHWCVLGLASSQWCWLAWSACTGRTLWTVPCLPWLGLEHECISSVKENVCIWCRLCW